MDDLLRLLLTNAGSAFLIALLAWVASRTTRRQAVVHGLWLLALVRLVTPPIAPVPLVPAWPGLALVSPASTPTVVSIPPGATEGILDQPAAAPRISATRSVLAVVQPAADVPIRSLAAPSAGPTFPLRSPSIEAAWRATAWLSLAAGALAITLLTAWRFSRFDRLLASAQPAPNAVAERTAALAARLGLRRVPPVLLVPARIPPMLWPHRSGPRLLLPEGLLADLHADELDTLLAHELAHVRRRDHWVRLVEIAATALFWWYPVTWWARRALRRAEERCCDEWVLRLLPRSAEAYANGLLKSLTFVTGTPGALPSLASGVGPVEDIEARLKEILMTRPVPRLAAPIRLALAAAAALGLAVFPTHAQSSATKEEPAAPAAATPAAAAPSTAPVAPVARPALPPRPGRTPPPAVAPLPALAPLAVGTPRPALAPVAVPDPAPQALPAPAPEPAIAGGTRTSDPARRAFEDQRRALEDQRRKLQQQEFELQAKQLELEAQAEQSELRAEAARLRAGGRADEAARVEKQLELTGRRMELQRRQLGLESERMALETKFEAEVRAQEARLVGIEEGARAGVEEGAREGAEEGARRALEHAEQARLQAERELEKKQQAIEAEVMQAEKQMQALAVEDQVRAMRAATDELARSLAEQIQSLKEAAAEAPSQRAAAEHEIQRLQAALAALQSGGTPKSSPRRTPRPQP